MSQEPVRRYAVDITDDLETIAEATLLDDGIIWMEIVRLPRDKTTAAAPEDAAPPET